MIKLRQRHPFVEIISGRMFLILQYIEVKKLRRKYNIRQDMSGYPSYEIKSTLY